MTDATVAQLSEAWNMREGPAVLTTVDPHGKPNAIYVGEIQLNPNLGFVVADNYFDKTRMNIKSGSSGAILFITGDNKAYQAKGALAYHTEGAIFEEMQDWHNPKHPGVAATVLQVKELYSGSEKLA